MSVRGRAAAPAVAVEANLRTADLLQLLHVKTLSSKGAVMHYSLYKGLLIIFVNMERRRVL